MDRLLMDRLLEPVVLVGGLLLVIGLLIGLLMWGYYDFGQRCEQMGGYTITSSVCVDRETKVFLMAP